MTENRKLAFSNGMRDGIPIATGYFAVSFTLGIAAKNAGFLCFHNKFKFNPIPGASANG